MFKMSYFCFRLLDLREKKVVSILILLFLFKFFVKCVIFLDADALFNSLDEMNGFGKNGSIQVNISK